ncbi:MAG: rhomboid family intramembrane serine protease [Deltaproteobacteria bacterium]|nr:rhomboid family intramembrane serine protease [Deltaproteobacteria bacterium]MBW2488709.1 rhomboid family intramembrane serine protease [Deltaproteobacteria bacterium]
MPNQKRQSLLCPNCKKLISASESRCPHCGTAHPAAWYKNNFWTRGFSDPYALIKAIIGLNIGIYLISLMLNPRGFGLALNPLTFLSPSGSILELLGATGSVPIDAGQRYWTLISANYLHGGVLHILFNMAAFRQLGLLVAREYGVYRMFMIYTLGGVIGFFVSYLAAVPWTIGASASVCSLAGALLYYGKSRGGVYGRTLYKQIGIWVVLLFMFGFLLPVINNWAHGGGIAAGIGLGFVLGYQERKKENIFHKLLAGGLAVLTLLILAWAILSGIYYRFTL